MRSPRFLLAVGSACLALTVAVPAVATPLPSPSVPASEPSTPEPVAPVPPVPPAPTPVPEPEPRGKPSKTPPADAGHGQDGQDRAEARDAADRPAGRDGKAGERSGKKKESAQPDKKKADKAKPGKKKRKKDLPPPPPPVPQDHHPSEGPQPEALWGVDVSRWQHPEGADIDWRALARSHPGMAYAFVKGTEGVTRAHRNPYLGQDVGAARRAGVAVGVYHYAAPNRPLVEDARAEAAAAVAAAGAPEVGTLPLVLDLEADHAGLSPKEMATWALTWLTEVERLSGRTPILYTYPVFFSAEVDPDPAFARYPLWIAHYGKDLVTPTVPAPWTTWTFWQYSSQGVMPGVASEVDLNVFAGSPAELALLAGVAPTGAGGATAAGVSLMGEALLSALTGPGSSS